jgi:hypothetical protein
MDIKPEKPHEDTTLPQIKKKVENIKQESSNIYIICMYNMTCFMNTKLKMQMKLKT